MSRPIYGQPLPSPKDRHRKIQNIAAELNVRYLLEGSVQRLVPVRVSAQLIDGTAGHHV